VTRRGRKIKQARGFPAALAALDQSHHTISQVCRITCTGDRGSRSYVCRRDCAIWPPEFPRRVLERRGRVADFSKAINSAGSRKTVRDSLDSIQRGRQPVSVPQHKAILRKRQVSFLTLS
jgi:hypothetical protein